MAEPAKSAKANTEPVDKPKKSKGRPPRDPNAPPREKLPAVDFTALDTALVTSVVQGKTVDEVLAAGRAVAQGRGDSFIRARVKRLVKQGILDKRLGQRARHVPDVDNLKALAARLKAEQEQAAAHQAAEAQLASGPAVQTSNTV